MLICTSYRSTVIIITTGTPGRRVRVENFTVMRRTFYSSQVNGSSTYSQLSTSQNERLITDNNISMLSLCTRRVVSICWCSQLDCFNSIQNQRLRLLFPSASDLSMKQLNKIQRHSISAQESKETT